MIGVQENKQDIQQHFTEILHETIRELTKTLSPKHVIAFMLERYATLNTHEVINVLLIENGVIQFTHWHGYKEDQSNFFKSFVDHLDPESFQKLMTLESHARYTPNNRPSWMNWIPSNDPYTYDSIQIKAHEQTIGFLNLGHRDPETFSHFATKQLQALAHIMAIAIANTQVYDLLQRNLVDLQALHHATSNILLANSLDQIGEKISQAVVEAFNKVDCGVMLIDENQKSLIRLARSGSYDLNVEAPLFIDGAGLVPEAVRTKKTVYVPLVTNDPRYVANDSRTRSELVIPLIRSDKIIGVLDLQSHEEDAFDMQDQRILQTFAEQAAIAIENVQLYEAMTDFAANMEQKVIERTQEYISSQYRAEAILNGTQDAIILVGTDGKIQQCNQAFFDLFGYRPGTEQSLTLHDLFDNQGSANLSVHIQNVIDQQQSKRIELLSCRSDDTLFDADVILSSVQSSTQGATDIVCSVRDITQRKQMERDLRRMLARERELHDLKSRFVSTASHEFRTPLAAILSSANIIHNYYDRMDDKKREQQFAKIEEQVNYMTLLLDDVLMIGRMESGKTQINFESLDLVEFIAEVVAEFKQTHSERQINYSSSLNQLSTKTDRKLMREIITNLISNALKYSPTDKPIDIDLIGEKTQYLISVRDYGIGIPEKDQPLIFETFHRATNVGTIQGTGLGLAIAKHAIQLHGGTIDFISKPQEGTTFTIRILNPEREF